MAAKPKQKTKILHDDTPLPITKQVWDTMAVASRHDPVGKQYLPSNDEKIITPNEDADPIGDEAHSPVTGLVHRYPDRVLLKITDTCAVYCRFCFRKEMVGKGQGVLNTKEIENCLSYIKNNTQIREVILSGGDPLTLSNRRLQDVLEKLETIPHLDIIRFHTRAPMVSPARIDDEFLGIIKRAQKAIYFVIHVNHTQEINDVVKDCFKKLSATPAILLSQSVLLKGINDKADILENLFRTLIKNRVKPYYLHHPDLAKGTGHFRVSIKQGQGLMKQLRGRLSGLALPTYVLDIPGGYGKVPIGECYAQNFKDGRYSIKDYKGHPHIYSDDRQAT